MNQTKEELDKRAKQELVWMMIKEEEEGGADYAWKYYRYALEDGDVLANMGFKDNDEALVGRMHEMCSEFEEEVVSVGEFLKKHK